MIEYGWRERLSPRESAELVAMLADAVREDEEGGSLRVRRTDPVLVGTVHLLAWLPADTGGGRRETARQPELAAYLRVQPVGRGTAVAHYVVRPALRSLGVTTLLLEGLGPLGGDGWAGLDVTELRIWARGDHPAAARAARRFRSSGVREQARRWAFVVPLGDEHGGRRHRGSAPRGETLARPPTGDREAQLAADLWPVPGRADPSAGAELLVVVTGTELVGAIWFDPSAVEVTDYGAAGRIEAVAVAGDVTGATALFTWVDLLRAALDRMWEKGRTAAVMTVPATDDPLAASARLVGFEHRRTDVEYTMSAGLPVSPS